MSIMNSINERKAARQTQRALRKDPNNIEALLQLATWLGTQKKPDLTQKRKVLHGILALEPGNSKARAMLFEMDCAEIGGDVSRLSVAVILTDPSSSNIAEQPLILRYSPVHQFLVYLLIAFTVAIGLSRVRNPQVLIAVGASLLLLIVLLWIVSVVVEISETGLRVSRVFGVARWEIAWRDIKAFNSHARGIKIITYKGNVVEISSQIIGYAAVLEILRQMRPDVFDPREVKKMAYVNVENEGIAYN